jgi:HPt (histidine-containing phosphotransfer) domain-containing protein
MAERCFGSCLIPMVDRKTINEPAISLDNVRAAFGHSPVIMVELLLQLQSSLRLQSADLEKAIEGGDLTQIAMISHRLAGSVGMFGASSLSAVCGRIKSAAQSDDLAAVQHARTQFAFEVRRVLDALASDLAGATS